MRFHLLSAFIVLLAAAESLSAARTEFTVTYVSADHVYIDGGAEDGLAVGDQLVKVSAAQDSVILEIVFAAGHSASCRVTSGTSGVAVGDRVAYHARGGEAPIEEPVSLPDTVSAPPEEPSPTEPTASAAHFSPAPVRLSGGLSLGFYYWADAGPANLDFSQSNARLTLKAQRLWNQHLTLALRTRGRYDARERSYGTVDRTEWENRLWELSFTYDNPSSRIYWSAGRLLPRPLSVVGYLDGALVELRLSNLWRIGLLGGQQPDWLYRTEDQSIAKGGGYLSFASNQSRSFSITQTIGGVGEYQSSRVSRSFIVSQGRVALGSRWGISHSEEIDIYTGLRKDRVGRSVSLSRAYVHMFWRAHRDVQLGLSYDNLRRYWTYDYVTLADSLFDDRVRQGWRLRADWSPSNLWSIGVSGGYRDRPDNEDPTLTYSLSIRRSDLLYRWLSASLSVNGFDGAFEHGLNYLARLHLLTRQVGQWHFDYGNYRYSVEKLNESRKSWLVETGVDTDIARHYFLSGAVQYNSGDDIDGWRLQAETGYRF